MGRALLVSCLLFAIAPGVRAQDPVEVDPEHYQVVFENDEVRVLLITYGPGEASVMHEHSRGVAIFVTDMTGTFTLPDGTEQPVEAKAGDVVWADAGQHNPVNRSDQPLKVYQVELKGGGE